MTATDLATTNGATAQLARVTSSTVTSEAMDRLANWVQAASQITALVSPLVGTPFIPTVDQKGRELDPEKVRAEAIGKALYGLSLGFDPLTSQQQVYVVHRRPGLYAKAKVALLESRGYKVMTLEYTAERATVQVTRPGHQHPDEPVTVTMEDAELAGWTTNDAYRKTPADMLWAKAAGRACDHSGSDVLLGIATVEDIHDPEPIRAEATVAQPLRGADLIAGQPMPAPTRQPQEPAAETPSDRKPDPDDEPGQQQISGPQSKKLHALLGKTDRSDRADGLRYLTLFLGREITTSKELTRTEANRVIDDLEAQIEAAAEINAEGQPELEP